MKDVVIGVDIGNATTEAAMACIDADGDIRFLKSALIKTSGIKGTVENVKGVKEVIEALICGNSDLNIRKVLLNDAAPVIADFAMDTITETVITDSAMIGHDPDTPGGIGLGTGYTSLIGTELYEDRSHIIVIPEQIGFEEAAEWLNDQVSHGARITGVIAQRDEGTLINNRLDVPLPIVDEVRKIEKVPIDAMCALEVAPVGYSVDTLSNPYGIATVFGLDAEETEYCKCVANALIGNRSAVVIKTPKSDIRERVIPAGKIIVEGKRYSTEVSVDKGADAIMKCIGDMGEIADITGEPGTNIGGMLMNVKRRMAEDCYMDISEINISDLFATDAQTAVPVKGGLSGEVSMETGVAVASMIRADRNFMGRVADSLQKELRVSVEVCGVEGEMALRGALTTPGTRAPVVMVDIGAGSTDAAYIDEIGNIKSVHLAGAGNMITMLIDSELDLKSFEMAEQIKKAPLARIDGLYRIIHENGNVEYREEPLEAKYYGRTVTVSHDGSYSIVDCDKDISVIRHVRREAKKRILVHNVRRVLERLGIDETSCRHVVLVGGSVLDFELSNILTEEMAKNKITAGKGNIRGSEGPRNAVATGLITAWAEKKGS